MRIRDLLNESEEDLTRGSTQVSPQGTPVFSGHPRLRVGSPAIPLSGVPVSSILLRSGCPCEAHKGVSMSGVYLHPLDQYCSALLTSEREMALQPTRPRSLAPKDAASKLARSIRTHDSLVKGPVLSSAARKLFICPHCLMDFGRKQELGRHIRCVHTVDMPWVCPACLKGFGRIDALRCHFSTKRAQTEGCRFKLGGLPIASLVSLSSVSSCHND
ncbi:uncharacterized protein BJ171DRAFT_84003 [Polychytrium aggregatum]|uniref:uncharacterized protein n=1 Tax=Polychytrium aggregatum TaxID=110093 RepID=UPI0022FEBC86|nr:uncharacterized protein BJ171DRAFT_84003 [Polychytrium aggregatum]KAI9205153.1 hypothetical protein BJ171DRAFT_84003 [Polychytrium aggregatum]